jgi:aminopeptidase N
MMDRQDADMIPQTIRLADYKVPDYLIDEVDLDIDLTDDFATVINRMHIRRNPDAASGEARLHLDGCHQELLSVRLNGSDLGPDDYLLGAESLSLSPAADAFELEITSRNKPHENTALEGLYMSGGMYCTQCEAQGFRNITYYQDRPDVMAVFRTTLRADKATMPVLLSNGNPVESGDLPEGRHFAVWHDPFPKPAYLFAMVAGDLGHVEDHFTTASGRDVTLHIFVEPGNESRCGHAMTALKKSMAWDERVYGLEYDLDLFMIVAVSHFNMGAMENKGLNVFNSKYVLADTDTATDADFENVEAIVAHEYFHNWTGNRVTCRDWFQLSLKEGLTVFRDQEFTADERSRGVKRVEDARTVRAAQFPEDAGPLAHPVRPESYIEINNFYTITVYEKGAEVVRMIHTLIGAEKWRAGMDLYFQRHDGQAVTCEDFVAAMEDASGVDLSRFRLWYSQAGTPTLKVAGRHDAQAQTYTLDVQQTVPATPGQPNKQPMPIPLAVGLLGPDGGELALRLEGEGDNAAATTKVLVADQAKQSFTFTDVPDPPVPSLLRGFSAPVKLESGLGDAERLFLMTHDPDPFVRWDSGQSYATGLMMGEIERVQGGADPKFSDDFIQAFGATLDMDALEPAFRAEAIRLPSEGMLADAMEVVDVDAIHAVRQAGRRAIAEALYDRLVAKYEECRDGQTADDLSTEAAGRRTLMNTCLAYLCATGRDEARALAAKQADPSGSMTNVLLALSALNDIDCAERDTALAAFEARWRSNPLVLDKWFVMEATAPLPGTLERVRGLLGHPGYDAGNPNRFRALVGAFAAGNPVCFHADGGAGYQFLADRVLELDRTNPMVAARSTQPLTRWRRYDATRGGLMRAQLERIAGMADLSKDVYEMTTRALAD